MIHYPIPSYQQPAYAEPGRPVQCCPVIGRIRREVHSLPVGPTHALGDLRLVGSGVSAGFAERFA